MVHIIDHLFIDAAPDFACGERCENRLLEYVHSGFEVVISLRTWEPLDSAYQTLRLEFHHIPIDDFGIPSEKDIRTFIRLMEQNLGRKTLVHCIAGRGRSGTMAALYLVYRGFSGEAAVRHVRERRPGAIETPEQEALVLEYRFSDRPVNRRDS